MKNDKADNRIRVVVEDEIVAVYKDENRKVCHTNDLAQAEQKHAQLSPLYLEIENLHNPARRSAMDSQLSLFFQNMPDEVSAAKTAELHAELQRAYSLNSSAMASGHAKREAFYEVYDQLPSDVRAIAKGCGLQAIIAGKGRDLSQLSGDAEDKRTLGFQNPTGVYFTDAEAEVYSTVLEEVSHEVDKWVHPRGSSRFSESPKWQKVLQQDMVRPKGLLKKLYFEFEQETGKGNTALNLGRNDAHYLSESLVDIIGIEHMLTQRINRDGDLTSIGGGVTAGDTVESVMLRAAPNMWQLYHGPHEGAMLVQDSAGKIQEIDSAEEIPAGSRKIESYNEACKRMAISLDMNAEVSLPIPDERDQDVPQLSTAQLGRLWAAMEKGNKGKKRPGLE